MFTVTHKDLSVSNIVERCVIDDMASSRGMKPFVTKFHGKAQLTSTEFMAVFRKYDKDGKFFVWLKILHKLSVIPAAASD